MKSTIQSRCHQPSFWGPYVLYILTGNRRNASLFDNTCFGASLRAAPCPSEGQASRVSRVHAMEHRGTDPWHLRCPPVVSARQNGS